jgi:hypothetical protein
MPAAHKTGHSDVLIVRSMHLLPKRGDKPQWQPTQDYWAEKDELPAIDFDDGALVYE